MKDKAFTLVELLAIIIVIGVILAIVVPKVLSTLDKSKENLYSAKEADFKKGAIDYTLYNSTIMPTNIGDRIKIGLADVTDGTFISKIYDLDDKTLCVGYLYITKTNTDNYEYLPCIFCTNYQTQNVNCDINEV